MKVQVRVRESSQLICQRTAARDVCQDRLVSQLLRCANEIILEAIGATRLGQLLLATLMQPASHHLRIPRCQALLVRCGWIGSDESTIALQDLRQVN